jgi:hypothetical protein
MDAWILLGDGTALEQTARPLSGKGLPGSGSAGSGYRFADFTFRSAERSRAVAVVVRIDGRFHVFQVSAHDTERLTEAFRRAVLRLFVRLELFDEGQAQGMLQWPHSGFHVHDAVWVDQDDHAFAQRLARYCARNPVALERLTYEAGGPVTYRSDKADGPTAGSETVEPLEFLARVLTHIPDKGQITTRYYGWYSNRTRGERRQAAEGGAPIPLEPAPPLALREARRRWAELLRQIFEVDPLACSRCGGTMRIIAFITARGVIDEILTHVRTAAASSRRPRSPPAPAARSA